MVKGRLAEMTAVRATAWIYLRETRLSGLAIPAKSMRVIMLL